MKKNINKHSFARRLTRWLMLVLFVMMAGLAYLIYEVVKMSMVEIVALNFHDIMELSEKNICDALSDVSVVVENNIFYIDRDIGQPAELQATMERMVAQNPEIMPYLINLHNGFTSFDIGTAMMLRSKYSQKMYEICCKYSGEYRHPSSTEKKFGYTYKKRVVAIKLDTFRSIFNLDEQVDPRTGKTKKQMNFKSYKDIRVNILKVAQEELYWMYANNASDVWFDFQPGQRTGKGGKVSSVLIYIYTREHPKQGQQRPWQKGDDRLDPYESVKSAKEPVQKKTPAQKIHSNPWRDYDHQDRIVYTLLSRYLTPKEVSYYMRVIGDQAKHFRDSYTQVIQVIQEKETQSKFANGTRQYKRNNIMDYVLQVNLKDYGWSIKPPSTRKERKREPDLFDG